MAEWKKEHKKGFEGHEKEAGKKAGAAVGHEKAGHEKAAHERAGHEKASHEKAGKEGKAGKFEEAKKTHKY